MSDSQIGKEDIFVLKLVGENTIPKAAAALETTEGAVRARLFRIRKRITRYTWYLNNVRSLQKSNPRIRKFTTSGQLSEEDELKNV